ncbi:MAG: hypothetical protein MJ227_03295 [Bacilli bacterium]|nr:hypothetical protein [Bacilli bacterium]
MKHIKNDIEFLGLDYKKEMTKIALLALVGVILGVVLYFVIRSYYAFIISLASIICAFAYVFLHYSSKKDALINNSEEEFVSLLSYFEVFISNHNNVYHSFELLIPYASDYMKTLLENFLKNIDSDKTVQPYINFARNFKNVLFESLLLSIYQMVDTGENVGSLSQFGVMFTQISANNKENKIHKMQKDLDTTNLFPLVGVGIVSFILIISIFSIIGDLINVI